MRSDAYVCECGLEITLTPPVTISLMPVSGQTAGPRTKLWGSLLILMSNQLAA